MPVRRVQLFVSGAAAALLALSLAGCGGNSTAPAADQATTAASDLDCTELLDAMQTHIMALSLVMQAGGSGTPVSETEADEFQVTVDRVAAAMPELPADASPYLGMSQELADILYAAVDEGATYDDILPEFEGVINDPEYQASSEAGEAFVMPQCPPPASS